MKWSKVGEPKEAMCQNCV